MFYVIDRIENDTAVLMGDDDTTVNLPRRQLPPRAREGSVFRVVQDQGGRPDWATAQLDEAERQRRRSEMRGTMERRRRRDPGGDIAI